MIRYRTVDGEEFTGPEETREFQLARGHKIVSDDDAAPPAPSKSASKKKTSKPDNDPDADAADTEE